MKIISLQEARDKSLTYYYTGKPCKRGHIAWRVVSSRLCTECDKERRVKFFEEDRANQIKWREDNPERYKHNQKQYRKNHQEYIVEWKRNHYIKNRESILQSCCEYRKKRYKEDPVFRAHSYMRGHLHRLLNHFKLDKPAGKKSVEILGYTPEELLHHLESLMLHDMTLDNMGSIWHIDHHIPVKEFRRSDLKTLVECNSLQNLYPMYVEDNIKKGGKPWSEWAELYPERAKLYTKQNRPDTDLLDLTC